MSNQSDLQNWLKQLKAKAQDGGAQGMQPSASTQQPSSQSHSQHHRFSQSEKRRKVKFDPDLIDTQRRPAAGVDMSATDIALAKMRREEKQRKQEAKKLSLEKKKRQAAALMQRQRQAAAERQKTVAGKKAKSASAAVSTKLQQTGGAGCDISSLHHHLAHNPAALKEAIILSEILGSPISLRKHSSLWDT